MLLERGNSPWGTHDGQYHSSELIHCTRGCQQKYSVDNVAECSEISTHGLENEICTVKPAPIGGWLPTRIGNISETLGRY